MARRKLARDVTPNDRRVYRKGWPRPPVPGPVLPAGLEVRVLGSTFRAHSTDPDDRPLLVHVVNRMGEVYTVPVDALDPPLEVE